MAQLQEEIAELVLEIVPQAGSIARRYYQKAPHALCRDDLESIAYEGLVQAASQWPGYCARNGYQPDGEGLKFFGAYATRRMNGAILDYMRSLDWVPRSVRQAWKSLQESGADAGATEAELSAGTGLPVAQIRATRAALARRPVSLDDGDRDVPGDRDVDSQVRVSQILAAVGRAGDMLSRPQRVVVALRYYQGMSVAEIALALGMPRRDVVAAHDQAVRAVREAMASAAA